MPGCQVAHTPVNLASSFILDSLLLMLMLAVAVIFRKVQFYSDESLCAL